MIPPPLVIDDGWNFIDEEKQDMLVILTQFQAVHQRLHRARGRGTEQKFVG